MILDFIINLDKNLTLIIQTYGLLIYPFLFLIIFIETGLVIMPFLPGDSILFASGVLASRGLINIFLVFLVAASAAIIGDSVNYWIGNFIGDRISRSRFIKKEHLIKTQRFYEKYGGKTIILARFIPIIRTFAPFIAGIGKMKYSKFLFFNVIGGLLWTFLFTFAGFFFGNIPFIKENFSIVILTIIIISFIPAIIELIKSKKHREIN
ncbi:SNARE associated Golgi protein [uncultured archaeon]|nr:SNARE associated Golgi protein [uncultured archaeon]